MREMMFQSKYNQKLSFSEVLSGKMMIYHWFFLWRSFINIVYSIAELDLECSFGDNPLIRFHRFYYVLDLLYLNLSEGSLQ